MTHRHITATDWSLMAIESLLDRGTLEDWREFARAIKRDPSLPARVRKVCDYRQPDGAERIALALLPTDDSPAHGDGHRVAP